MAARAIMTAMPSPENSAAPLFASLSALAGRADGEGVWPAQSWELLERLGGLRWCIPKAYGGQEYAGVELLKRYERLATACLTTCFILSQRDAACRRIRDFAGDSLCRELLPPLANAARFATVGLS